MNAAAPSIVMLATLATPPGAYPISPNPAVFWYARVLPALNRTTAPLLFEAPLCAPARLARAGAVVAGIELIDGVEVQHLFAQWVRRRYPAVQWFAGVPFAGRRCNGEIAVGRPLVGVVAEGRGRRVVAFLAPWVPRDEELPGPVADGVTAAALCPAAEVL